MTFTPTRSHAQVELRRPADWRARVGGVGNPRQHPARGHQDLREAGFKGGSVEKISKAAKSYDRMIYYQFSNTKSLFVAVLEEIYRRFNDAESGLDLDLENRVESLAAIIRFALTYYEKQPEFVRLLNSENLEAPAALAHGEAFVKDMVLRGISANAPLAASAR